MHGWVNVEEPLHNRFEQERNVELFVLPTKQMRLQFFTRVNYLAKALNNGEEFFLNFTSMNVTTEKGGSGRLDGVENGTDLDFICNSAPCIVEMKRKMSSS